MEEFRFLFLALFPIHLLAQYPNIRVSKIGSLDPEEVTIAINLFIQKLLE